MTAPFAITERHHFSHAGLESAAEMTSVRNAFQRSTIEVRILREDSVVQEGASMRLLCSEA